MPKTINNTTLFESKLYNKIVALSRNKLLYSKFNLNDSFQNRIYLIFIHLSFLFAAIKKNKKNPFLNSFNQNLFDYTFEKIELNMREIGYGDVAVNKNMKLLVKDFYNILFFCEKYKNEVKKNKISFIKKYLSLNSGKNDDKNDDFIIYLDKYHAFCLDLSSDSVLKGEINYNYN
tara:strand:- start:2 stop:526 length:525 start_codon:yes stop_codon:yes gene_type:complete